MKKNNGITLVALVITIIILLILSGISIQAMTNTGLFGKAKLAKNLTEIASEEEAINLYMINKNIYSNNNEQLGEKLYDKTIENGSKWNIIVKKENNEIYGTGWMYVAKNIDLGDYGKLKYNWLINENTGKIIRLEENSYVKLSYDETLGSTDGLIFNLDPSIIDNIQNVEQIQSQLGDNVELINFDWNDESGVVKSSFNFDGVDDYIKIEYDNTEEKQQLADNGFTFEFYGIFDGGTSYNTDNEIIENNYKGLFCYYKGSESAFVPFRCGISGYGTRFVWNAGLGKYQSDYSQDNSPWNIYYEGVVNNGEECYITLTLDCSNVINLDGEEYYKQTFFKNGEKLCEGNYNKKEWDSFIENYLDSLKYFCVGRCSMGTNGFWHYSKMNAYTLRLYNRALTEEEVIQNYDKSVIYHNSLID